jgi:flagellar biosynthesis regulator FlbT
MFLLFVANQFVNISEKSFEKVNANFASSNLNVMESVFDSPEILDTVKDDVDKHC